MASERVAFWRRAYGSAEKVRTYVYFLEHFLVDQLGLLPWELGEWGVTTGRPSREFLEDFCARNEGRPWADSLRKDLEDWGYF